MDSVNIGKRRGGQPAQNRQPALTVTRELPRQRKAIRTVVILCAIIIILCASEKKTLGQPPTNVVVDANSFYNLFDYTTGTAATGSAWIAQQGSSLTTNPPFNQQIRLGVETGGITVSGYTGTLGTALGSEVQRLNNQEYYETRTRPGTGGAGQPAAVEEWRVRPGITWSGGLALPATYNEWQATTVANGGTPPNLPAGRVYPDPFESSHWTGGVTPASPNVTVQDINNRTLGFQAGGPTMATHGSRATLTFEGYNAGNGSGGVIFNGGGTYFIIGQSNTVVRFGAPTLAFTNIGTNTWRWQFNYPAGNDPTRDRIVYSRVYFVNNEAASGGAIDNAGTLTLTRVTLNANKATGSVTTPGFGGAISNILGGTLILDDTSFGGAIPDTSITLPTGPSNLSTPAYLSALNIFLPGGLGNTTQVFAAPPVARPFNDQGNTADYGGAIYNLGVVEGNANAQNYVNFLDGTEHYPGIIFANNQARISGGAIFNDQGGTISASAGGAGHVDGLFRGTFVGNFAVLHGGAIFNDKDGIVRVRGNFDYNYVTAGHGGAIYNVAGGDVTLDGVEFQGNVAGGVDADALTNTLTGYGGAIYNLGTLNFGRDRQAGDTYDIGLVTFTNNRALLGGGIYTSGAVTSNGSVYFSSNQAREDGGAMYNLGRGITFSKSTFMLNTAGRDGGALFNFQGELTLDAVRFSGNLADGIGGAVLNHWGTLTFGGTSGDASFTDNVAEVSGGALYNDHGTITLRDGSFTRNRAETEDGGAIYNLTGRIRAQTGEGVTFTDNRAVLGSGGAIYNEQEGFIEFWNSSFSQNFARIDGGAIYNKRDGEINITNATFTDGFAETGSGGAIYNEWDGLVVITRDASEANPPGRIGGFFDNNIAGEHGGAIYNQGRVSAPGATMSLSDVEFFLNTATFGDGGAIYNGLNAVLTINDPNDSRGNPAEGFANLFSDNKALGAVRPDGSGGRGGAIFNAGIGFQPWESYGVMDIYNARFMRNEARTGGAIHNLGDMLIDNRGLELDVISFGHNTAMEHGGAIYNDEFGMLELHRGSFLRNAAVGDGGAIFNANDATMKVVGAIAQDSLTLTEGTFALNTANDGGAIFNQGMLTLSGETSRPEVSTFNRNTADNRGGAVFNDVGAVITLNDVSFASNEAAQGGAIYNAGADIAAPGAPLGGIVNLNVHNIDSTFGFTDDVFFGGGAGEHQFNVDISAGRTLLMRGGMSSNAGAVVQIRQTGGGTWILENPTGNAATYRFDVGGEANFDVYAGSLELRRDVQLGLGTGRFALHGAGTAYTDVNGRNVVTEAGNRLNVDTQTGIFANEFIFGADTILEFNTELAFAGETYLTLTFGGGGNNTVDVSSTEVWIATSAVSMQTGEAVILIDIDGGDFINTDNLPTLFVDGGTGQVFVRGENGTPYYGLAYGGNDTQLLLVATASDTNTDNLVWTGLTDSMWDTVTENWQGTVMGNPVNTFLNGDSVTFNDTALADNRTVNILQAGGVQVGNMVVTAEGYRFNLGGNITADGDIKFGSATVSADQGAGTGRLLKADTIILGAGGTLEFDMTGARTGANNRFLTLETNGATAIESDIVNLINAASIPLVAGGHMVLVQTTGAGGLIDAGLPTLYMDGIQSSGTRSSSGGLLYGLRYNDNHTQLQLAAVAGNFNADISWTGQQNSAWDAVSDNWYGVHTANGLNFTLTNFFDGDSVTFANTANGSSVTNKIVNVTNPVRVGTMNVTGSDYVFNVAIGSTPTITAGGNINLGSSVLNITGYTPAMSDFSNTHTVIRSSTGITGFANYKVAGESDVDFLRAQARQQGNDIVVDVALMWNSTSAVDPAHGNFTIVGRNESFTLGVPLANRTDLDPSNTWNGNSLTKRGDGALYLTGNNTYTGLTRVESGTLGGTGTIAGKVEVLNGATITGGTLGGVGRLNVKSLDMKDGSTIHVDFASATSFDRIDVANEAVFGPGVINVSVGLSEWITGDYTIVSTGTGITDNGTFNVDLGTFANAHHGAAVVEENARLVLKLFDQTATLYWDGTADPNGDVWQHNPTLLNWKDNGTRNQYFRDGDAVIFDNTAANKNVKVEGTVYVENMTVRESGYTFDLTAGASPAIVSLGNTSSGAINLGNASLNITGYVADITDSYTGASNVLTLISAAGPLTGFSENVRIAGETEFVDYMSAHVYQEANDIKIATELSWYSKDPNSMAHGNFTIGSGEFTLGAVLVDNTNPGNLEPGWNGKALTKKGEGTLILTAKNTFSGGSTVEAGTLQIGNGGETGNLASGVNLQGVNSRVVFNRSDEFVFGKVISGDGSLTQAGTGTLILTANNNYAGGTTVSSGSLQIGKNGTSGGIESDIALANNTNVTFSRSDDYTYDGIVSGAGSLVQAGDGALTLNAWNTYTGGTRVTNGQLLIGGDYDHRFIPAENSEGQSGARIDGPVVVENGGLLGGYGVINGAVTVRSGGYFSPGGSVGTLSQRNAAAPLTVTGDITFEEGSTYLYEIAGDNHDLLSVDNRYVNIEQGAQLEVSVIGSATQNRPYQVIDASLSQFDGLTHFTFVGAWANMFRGEFRDDGYWISWRRFADIIGPYASGNAIRAADGVDRINDLGIFPESYYAGLAGMDAWDIAGAFEQLHGEVFASNKDAALQSQRRFQRLIPTGGDIVAKSDNRQKILERKWNLWGNITGGYDQRNNIGRYSGYRSSSAGFAAGMDRTISPFMLIGVAVGYDHADQNFKKIRSSSDADAMRTMAYASWFNGSVFVDAYGGYTKNWYKTKRNINIGSFSAKPKARYNDDLAVTGIEFGRVHWFDKTMLTPSVGLHYARLNSPSFTETRGGDANLYVASDMYQSFQTSVGAKVSRMFTDSRKVVWTPEIRAYYVHEWSDDRARAITSFAAVRDINFEAHGGRWGRDSGRFGAGVGALLTEHINFRFDYDFEVFSNTSTNTFTTTLGVTF